MIYIQVEDYSKFSVDLCYLMNSINFKEWFYDDKINFEFVKFNDLNNLKLKTDDIPIGSVEFVGEFSSLIGRVYKPLYIKELFNNRYTDILNKDNILKLFKTNKSIFIKEFDVFKSNFSDNNGYIFNETSAKNLLDDDKKYFVSEIITDIESEYRIFMKNNEVVGIKNYSGDIFKFPNESKLKLLINNIKELDFRTNSLTIDIALTSKDEILVLEWHPFISVGLYGFDEPNILIDMYIESYKNFTIKRD